MSTKYDYDYLVIGAGSGGVSSAKRAAQLYKKKVAVVEGGRMGGTCVNVGCVPKKIMFQAASFAEILRHDAKAYCLTTPGEVKFDWGAMKEKRDKYIVRLNNIYFNGLKNAGVTVYDGHYASFVDAHTVELVKTEDGSKQTLTSEHILIATGGKPYVPDGSPGVKEHTITSDGFFELTEQPKKAVVVGAGYIAVEMAGVMNALGSDVHLVVRKQKALRNFDPEISDFLDAVMKRDGVTVHSNTGGVSAVELNGDGTKKVTCSNGEVVDGADIVLMAPGRIPNVDGLNLSAAGVEVDGKKNGVVVADEYQNTSAPNIYAVGDVCGEVELTPMAIAAGRRLSDRLFSGGSGVFGAEADATPKTSYDNVPTVVFSHPPIGTCGVTEPQAVAKYGADNIKVYKSTFVNLYYSMFDHMQPSDKPKTYVKIICAGVEEQVVGLHIIGMAADEMMQGFGVAMKMNCTKADLDACIAIHPTASEEVVTMGTWGTSPQYTGAKVSPLMGAKSAAPTILEDKQSKM